MNGLHAVLIPALVAGVVSLVGLGVNLLIARESHKSQRSLEAFKVLLGYWSETITESTGFVEKAERLRVECWRLVSQLEAFGNAGGEVEPAVKNVVNAMTELDEQWVKLKACLGQSPYVGYIREARHNCRRSIETLPVRQGAPSVSAADVRALLALVDHLIELVFLARSDTLVKLSSSRGFVKHHPGPN